MAKRILILGFLVFRLFLSSPVFSGEATPAWQEEWEKTLAAAKKEGQVTLYIQSSYDEVFKEFQRKYPEIRVKTVGEPERRIMVERRAGQFLADLYLGGIVTPNIQFYPAKALEPIKPILILPEVVDESKWWRGRHHYADPAGQYIFVFDGNVHGADPAYNTNVINPKAFESYWDFLDPKWKGRIVALDPKAVATVDHGLRFIYNHPRLGPEFIRRFFGEMNLMLTRDKRQMLDWLAVGKLPIAFFGSGVETAAEQGLPVKMFDLHGFKEGAGVGPRAGSVCLLKLAPHPNAARVAVNWLLSREGQNVFQKILAQGGSPRESMREDIPKDLIPASHRRVKGTEYFYTGRPEYIANRAAVNQLVNEALGRR